MGVRQRVAEREVKQAREPTGGGTPDRRVVHAPRCACEQSRRLFDHEMRVGGLDAGDGLDFLEHSVGESNVAGGFENRDDVRLPPADVSAGDALDPSQLTDDFGTLARAHFDKHECFHR
jgi:hypothetical protein